MTKLTSTQYTIRRAGYEDVAEIAALMQEVYEGMEDKETFICDDSDFVMRHIETEGFILIAENRTLLKLCAVFIVRYPQKSDDNLGHHLNMNDEDLLRVAHMESAVVSKDARGNHLEEQMMRLSETYIYEKYDIYMGMASPKNVASIKAFLNNGFVLAKENIDYNGYKRNLYLKYKNK